VRGDVEMRKQRETDQTDGTARRGRREYVRGAVLRGDPIQLGHVSGDTEGDTRGRHTSFSRRGGRREKFSGREIRFFGKFSVSGATRKVFSGPISDFSVSKFKNS